MQFSSVIRAVLIALAVAGAGLTVAYADSGSIRFNVIKAGFVVGGSGGSGTLLPRPQLPDRDRWDQLRLYLRRLGDRFCRASQQHSKSSRRQWRIRRRQRRCGARRGRGRDRAHQPEWRGAHAVGSPSGINRRRRPQRIGDLGALVGETRLQDRFLDRLAGASCSCRDRIDELSKSTPCSILNGCQLNCWNPHNASRAETMRPAHDTDIGIDRDPIWIFHPRSSLTRWTTATIAKINAEMAA